MNSTMIHPKPLLHLRQSGCVVWLTGLSGSGKSTLAAALTDALAHRGYLGIVLDGDQLRAGLCRDLGFSPADRQENVRRLSELSSMLAEAGLIAVVALISPYQADRDRVRQRIGADRLVEVFCDAPLSVCEQRDPKGLYARARSGQIDQFTGVSAPYERPAQPHIRLDTTYLTVESCVETVYEHLCQRGFIFAGSQAAGAAAGAPARA